MSRKKGHNKSLASGEAHRGEKPQGRPRRKAYCREYEAVQLGIYSIPQKAGNKVEGYKSYHDFSE